MTDTTDPNCPICKRPGRRRIIDADASDGLTPAAIAATMRDTGWALTAAQVATHVTLHTISGKPRSGAARRRDAALTLRERLTDEFERQIEQSEALAVKATEACARGEHKRQDKDGNEFGHEGYIHDPAEFFNILAKDVQPALGTIIKAQTVEEKRVAVEGKRRIDLFKLMQGTSEDGLAPRGLIGDGIIEGEAIEVTE